MRFLFVDRVTHWSENEIQGSTLFSQNSPFQYSTSPGGQVIAPGVVSEAIGQLVSWLGIKRNDFTGRPVFMFADRITIRESVQPGSEVALSARIDSMDSETILFSGEARVRGNVVQTVEGCTGFFMTLDQLEDPTVTRQRFDALLSPGGLVLERDGPPLDFELLMGEIPELEHGRHIEMRHVLSEALPFYADHFPRFPVTPIVMINEMIGRSAQRMFPDYQLVPVEVSGIKIKSFLRPAEDFAIVLDCIEEMKNDIGDLAGVNIQAELVKGGKRVLRARYTYACLQRRS